MIKNLENTNSKLFKSENTNQKVKTNKKETKSNSIKEMQINTSKKIRESQDNNNQSQVDSSEIWD